MSGEGKRPRGRPCTYRQEVADEILQRMANGESLNAICKDESMPPESTVRGWAIDDREGFAARFARASQIRAYRWADEIIEFSDRIPEDGDSMVAVQRTRVQTDNRKWIVSKMIPKEFGDRAEQPEAERPDDQEVWREMVGMIPGRSIPTPVPDTEQGDA